MLYGTGIIENKIKINAKNKIPIPDIWLVLSKLKIITMLDAIIEEIQTFSGLLNNNKQIIASNKKIFIKILSWLEIKQKIAIHVIISTIQNIVVLLLSLKSLLERFWKIKFGIKLRKSATPIIISSIKTSLPNKYKTVPKLKKLKKSFISFIINLIPLKNYFVDELHLW